MNSLLQSKKVKIWGTVIAAIVSAALTVIGAAREPQVKEASKEDKIIEKFHEMEIKQAKSEVELNNIKENVSEVRSDVKDLKSMVSNGFRDMYKRKRSE